MSWRQSEPNTLAMIDSLTDAPNTSLLVWISPITGEPVPSSWVSFLPNWLAVTPRTSVARTRRGSWDAVEIKEKGCVGQDAIAV